MLKPTPIQSLIKEFSEPEHINMNSQYVLNRLKEKLLEERKLMEDTWDEGAYSAYNCRRVYGESEFDKEQHKMERKEYFKQFAKE